LPPNLVGSAAEIDFTRQNDNQANSKMIYAITEIIQLASTEASAVC
jgi:hypothetical protein